MLLGGVAQAFIALLAAVMRPSFSSVTVRWLRSLRRRRRPRRGRPILRGVGDGLLIVGFGLGELFFRIGEQLLGRIGQALVGARSLVDGIRAVLGDREERVDLLPGGFRAA